MATNLFLKRFDDVEEGHEQLVELSLSTPTSTSTSSNPIRSSSSSSSLGRQALEILYPCNSNDSRKRLLFESFYGEEDDEGLDLTLKIGPPGPSPLASSSTYRRQGQNKKRSYIINYNHNLNIEPEPEPERERVPEVDSKRTAAASGLSYHQLGPTPRVPRRNPFQTPKGGKGETIVEPYPWATTRRATLDSLENLVSRQIFIISGDLECKGCQETFTIEYKLPEKFMEIKEFVLESRSAMHDRAPEVWMNPRLDNCRICASSLKPVITKKRKINWLFLLLGQMLGCCKLSELKYFCKHTKNHRTGAKDRLVYLTYLTLCKQLDPDGPF